MNSPDLQTQQLHRWIAGQCLPHSAGAKIFSVDNPVVVFCLQQGWEEVPLRVAVDKCSA